MPGSADPTSHLAGEPIVTGQVHGHGDLKVLPAVQRLFDLSGRVALVTRAGSGLGVVFAEALAEAGAAVVCVGRWLERVQGTANRLHEIRCQSLPISAEVTNAAVIGMVPQTVERFGTLDIVGNNAGTAVVGPPESISLADWQRVVDVKRTSPTPSCSETTSGHRRRQSRAWSQAAIESRYTLPA